MGRRSKPLVGGPPGDITGDTLAEWHRVVEAARDAGHELKPADRSALALYCRTWAINATCYQHIQQFGAIIKWPNGLPGPSPQYKTYKETATLLRGLLADLGLTPASRDFDAVPRAEPAAPGALDF